MEETKESIKVSITEKQLKSIFSERTISEQYKKVLTKKERALKVRIKEINDFLIQQEREAIQENVVKEEFILAFRGVILKKAIERMFNEGKLDMRKNILQVLNEKNLEQAIQGSLLPSIVRKLVRKPKETDCFWDNIHFGSFLLQFDAKFLNDKTLKYVMTEAEE